MANNLGPEDVADAFVKQYYYILNKSPENVHKFYQEPSVSGWQGPDGIITPVKTLSGIDEKIMSSDYKHCSAELKTIDSQGSLAGGIMVSVTGCLTLNDEVKKNFVQTFFLAKQARGFFVLNDILRFFDASETTTNAAANSNVENYQHATMQNIDAKGSVENGEVEKSTDHDVSKGTLADGAPPSLSLTSDERAVPPAANAKSQSIVVPAKKPKKPSAAGPAKILKVPSVVTPPSSVAWKVTFASMVAKENTATSPRAAAVASNVQKQTLASSITKASAPPGNNSKKVSTPNCTVSKAVTSSGKAAPRPYAEARGIYIGGLPYDITKQGVVDVVKKFGPVRRYSDTVQIKRHEDGFCCGFVEFESADAARRAVEAHHVMFDEMEAYITYKRTSVNRGKGDGARSPTRGGNRNGRRRARGQGRSPGRKQAG